jgi:SH3-like domain-containing protein
MVMGCVRAIGAALAVVFLFSMSGMAAETRPASEAMRGERGAVTNLPLPRFVSLRAETANARRGPSLSHRIDWKFMRRGWPLQVTAEYGQWRRVRDAEGAGGWVHQSLLSGIRTVVLTGSEMVPIHSAQSEASAVLAYAEPGVVARLEICEEEWCQVSINEADGWVPRPVLWGVE